MAPHGRFRGMGGALGVALALAAGCSGAGGGGVFAGPAPPADGLQVAFGPFDVAAGKEVQLCHTMKLPNEAPMAVNRLQVVMAPGSHHFILFRSKKDFPEQIFPCWGTVNFDDWDFVMDVNKAGGTDWSLKDGQAMVLEPHQQVMVQSHFVNATTVQSPEGGMSYLNLYAFPMSEMKNELRGLFTVDTRIAIPPHGDYTTSKNCTPSTDVSIVAMTGHFHARGLDFTVDHYQIGDAQYGEADQLLSNLYCSGPGCPEGGSWDAPVFKVFDPPQLIHAGIERFRFTCTYHNDTDTTIGFGGHADVQEHCNLFFQYYVSDGISSTPLTCIEGSGGW